MKSVKKLMCLSVVSALALTSCKKEEKTTSEFAYNKANKDVGINTKLIDYSENPKHHFFKFINGTWLKNNEIPADRTRWGSFDELRKMTDDDVLNIIEKAIKDTTLAASSDQGKAVALYQSILNTEKRNQQGFAPILPAIEAIEDIKTMTDLEQYIIKNAPKGIRGFFGTYVGADSKDSNKNVVYLGAGSLGLPDRDYYVKEDEDSKEKREKYKQHIAKMFQYVGDNAEKAQALAQQILAFETKLAEPKMDKVERRDARKRYNPTAINDLQKMVPQINWTNYYKGIGIEKIDTVIVSELKYTKALNQLFAENNVADWKAYLKWTVINKAASKLSEELEKSNWEFYSKTLKGAKEQRPAKERALATVNRNLGEALGQLYVAEKFPPEAKAKAQKMIDNVLKAFGKRIEKLTWMSEETKLKALEKLYATTVKIGYPDEWEEYNDVEVSANNTYYANMQNIAVWGYKKMIDKLNEPVDKTEWHMAPQTVNAYFNPSYNEIVFPAAILQPPFYDYNADDAVNYGGIGAVIGHEISHSFDDSGARYDKDGNLNNWWTEEDAEKFKALGDALAQQYSNIEVLPKTQINGAFTLGENIGDLGGINVAYDALQLHYAANGKPEPIDGFTAEQRFFMSWATVWRTKYRDEALKNQIKTDPHSPGMVRAGQPLKNVDAFYDAFNIKQGDSMYIAKEQRVRIW